MATHNHSDLIDYINYIMGAEQLSQRKFVEQLSTIAPNEEELDSSVLNRILRSKTEARHDTLRKVSIIITRNPNATVEDLWNKVEVYKREIIESSKTLRVGTGFTSWASVIVNIINRPATFPSGIEFTFCSVGTPTEDRQLVPHFFKSGQELAAIKDIDHIHRFIAPDLQQLLNDKTIDCAFILRKTAANMIFSKLRENEKPIFNCRIAVGFGTHMYAIKQDTKSNFKINRSDNSLDSLIAIREALCDFIKDKQIRPYLSSNDTVEKNYNDIFKDAKIKASVTRTPELKRFLEMDTEAYEEEVKNIANILQSEKDTVILLCAFEPITDLIFQRIKKEVGSVTPICCEVFNLAQLVNDKSAYGLLTRADVLKNPHKLKKINELLMSIDQYIDNYRSDRSGLIRELSWLSSLFYGDEAIENKDSEDNRITPVEKMAYSLNELEYTNQYLPFINATTDIILNLQNNNSKF